MTLQSYKYSFLERLWLKLEAHSADKNTENIVMILPVLLFMLKKELETRLDTLPQILEHYLKPHLIQRVFSHIVIKLQKYTQDEELFMQERQEAFECLSQNIQLYTLVIDMFDNQEDNHNFELIKQVVRKKFDEDYELNQENLRLLAYQEKYSQENTSSS